MKKIVAFLLLFGVVLSLCACGNSGTQTGTENVAAEEIASGENSVETEEISTEDEPMEASETQNITGNVAAEEIAVEENSAETEESSAENTVAEEVPAEENSAEEEPKEAEVVTEEEAEPEETIIYHFGDTVTVADGMFEFSPVFEGFYDELSNWPDANIMTPGGISYGGGNPFKADEEKKMMFFSGTIKCVGDPKENASITYTYSVRYDTGYNFNCDCGYYSVITDDATWESFSNVRKITGEGDNTAVFEPLSSNDTRYIRFCIEVPNQLEADAGNVVVTFSLLGEEYLFAIG